MIVGITGSIAMGKSVVTNYLISLGYKVIDSDKIVKEQLLNEDTKLEIVHHFGNSILNNNEVDRGKLGKIIFNNANDRELLNSIIHPHVIKKIKDLTNKHENKLIFVDIPLLYEAKLEDIVNKVIVIYTSFETQFNRLIMRDQISKEYAYKKISSQMDIELKKAKADFLIDNNLDLNNTYSQIDNILRRLKNEI